MKITKFKNLLVACLLLLVGSVFVLTNSGQSANEVTPIFNAYPDANGQGNEADFVRVRKTGTQNAFTNNVDDACTAGQEVSLQIYIHNGASQDFNGTNFDGSAVATDTTLALTKSANTVSGRISASNAPSVTDTATVTCNGQPVEFDFVQGSAIQTNTQGNKALENSVFTPSGALVGFETNNGIMPACWEYVTIVYAKVVVKAKEEPKVVKQCVLVDPKRLTRTRYEVTANASVENTTVQSYTFTTTNAQGQTVDTETFTTQATSQMYLFEQQTPGTYKVKAVIQTADGVADGNCEVIITVEEQPKAPAYSCDMFKLTLVDRKASVSFVPQASNGATFKEALIRYNADGTTRETVTTNAVNAQGKIESNYTFAEGSKNIEAVATVRFNVPNGSNVEVKEVICREAKVLGVRTPEQPKELPKTGVEGVAGLFAGVTAAGAALHRKMTLRRK